MTWRLIVLIGTACALANGAHAAQPAAQDDAETESSGTVVELTPGAARPGDAVMVTLRGETPCPTIHFGDRELRFFDLEGGCRAVVALPVEQKPGDIQLTTLPSDEGEGEPELLGTLEVRPADFNVRELTVSRKFVKPSAKQRKRMKADRKAFAKAYAQKWAAPMFTQNFAWPRRDVITAPFGDLRTFNGKKQSQHYGTDIDGRIGDPIKAANDGVVVMSRDNYAAGRTVLIHHGADIYSAYFHLTEIQVKEGQRVKQGEQIGTVGKSGRVTGPHLHWSVKVGGLYVDPLSILKLDFTN